MGNFTHLHLHTQYSILDGAAAIKPLMKRVKELGMTSVAITDHGNMYGVKLFHKEALAAGVKPILGCEVYVAEGSRFDKTSKNDRGDHLILLAKNQVGYSNLVKMVSYSWTEGFHYKPRVDKELIEKYHEGLICASACLGGEIPQLIMNGDLKGAEQSVLWFKNIFGEDYYLELQSHYSTNPLFDNEKVWARQQEVNRALIDLSQRLGIKLIATNDVHFINAEDWEAHDRLICLNTASDLDDPKRLRYTGQEFLKSYDQMLELFPEHPEALENTFQIAESVEVYDLDHKPYMPNFPLPESFELLPDVVAKSYLKSVEKAVKAAKDDQKRQRLQQVYDDLTAACARCQSIEELDSVAAEFTARLDESETLLMLAKQFVYLEYITWEGAKVRYGENVKEQPECAERIAFELATIEWMGFPGYFLIVWDFIRAAREMNVSVGPGRGSAAGSVVAYCLTITNIDPLKYGLLFERFLNPERISMPDIDIDFDEDGRADVMKYVVDKYGKSRVAQIITFGTMAAKMAIKDVARVQKLDLAHSNRLAKMVPERPGISLADAFKEVPELNAERESENQLIRSTLNYAQTLEGSVRQTGVHACGVIIGKDDLENYIPLARQKDAELFVVQYDGKHVEDVGLLKMDFLGLKTLSIIKDAIENIKLSTGEDIDIDKIPLDDEKTYQLYSRGETTGLFQFESPGMKKHLRNLKPNRFEDLIAMNALYRPGPMEYIPNFIARKHGLEPISYDLPDMESDLSNTYGITVYQEQVMLLSQRLAGFTKGQADTLRKAMGKKKIDVLNKMKDDFIAGVQARNHDPKICEKIWQDWAEFAKYAFNKSHATCYAYVSYQTAYLKTHYPSQFMAALLSRNLSDRKKISFFMDECKRMGISVFGPDVNESLHKFSVDKANNVRFGLAAVTGVGEAAAENIIQTRLEGGPYKSIFDFMERINLHTVNKKCLEELCRAGALDSISGFERSKFFAKDAKDVTFLEQLLRYGNRVQFDRNNAQQSLFGASADGGIQPPEIPTEVPWSKLETLKQEREVIGIYLSSHPLNAYSYIIKRHCNIELSAFSDLKSIEGLDFTVAGIVTKVQNLMTKTTSKPYGKFTIEDYSESYEFTLYSRDYEQFRQYMYEDYFLSIKGKVQPHPYREGELEIKITSIVPLDKVEENIHELYITLSIDELTNITISVLEDLFEKYKPENPKEGVPVKFRIIDAAKDVFLPMVAKNTKIKISNEMCSVLDNYGINYSFK